MNYTKRTKKKRKRKFLFFLFIICLALALAYYFDLFDVGLGGLTNGNEKEPSTTTQENSSSDSNIDSDNNTSYIEIRIKDDQITLNDEVVTLDELESKIKNLYSDNTTIKLIDNIAYESTYNSVNSLLKEMNLVVIYEEDGRY